MSRQPSNGEVAALRVWMQQLEEIQPQFSEQDRQDEQPRTAAVGSTPVAEIPLDDWDALLNAVKARLRATVGELRTRQSNGVAAPWQASVLECVDALDKLQTTLSRAVAAQGAFARCEPHSPPPELPPLDSPQLPLDLRGTTAPPAMGAAGLESRDT